PTATTTAAPCTRTSWPRPGPARRDPLVRLGVPVAAGTDRGPRRLRPAARVRPAAGNAAAAGGDAGGDAGRGAVLPAAGCGNAVHAAAVPGGAGAGADVGGRGGAHARGAGPGA